LVREINEALLERSVFAVTEYKANKKGPLVCLGKGDKLYYE
jgi:hypothetical protein